MPVTPPPSPKPTLVPPPPRPGQPSSGSPALKTAGSSSVTKSPSPIPVTSRTKLQVWDGKATVDNVVYFVDGPVNVNWAGKDFRWWFDYKTNAPGFAGRARWEISRSPFVDLADWKPTDGYGYTGVADGTQFRMDLKPYAPIPGYLTTTAKVPGPPKVGTQVQSKPANASPAPPDIPGVFNPTAPGTSSKPGTSGTTAKMGAPQPPAAATGAPGTSSKPGTSGTQAMVAKQPPSAATGPVAAAEPGPVKLPPLQSLYVRVVPLDSNGADADLPSNFVELKFGPAEKAPPFKLDPAMWPQITFLPGEYRPVQGYTSDWQCWVKATQDFSFPSWQIHKGDVANSCNHHSDVLSDFADAVEGFVSLLKSFVNGVSSAFDSIKSFATSTIAGALGCSSNPTCKTLIETGLDAGLVALGMPPDLPDFDALEAMGEDYLAETIAQQVAAQTGVPFADEATKAAVKKMIDEGKKAADSGGGGSSNFWIPDDGHQYKPLLVMLSVSNPGAKNTAAMYLEITETGTRYKGATALIPSLQPNQSFKVGIALQATKDPKAWMALLPTKDDYTNPLDLGTAVTKTQQAEAALKAWRSEYLSGTVTFRAKLILSPFDKQVFERSCKADQPACLVQ